jgi:hypothetical protein
MLRVFPCLQEKGILMLKSNSRSAACALAAGMLLASYCCIAGQARGAEGPPQVNAEFLKKAQGQSDAVVRRLQSLADRDGKPHVALVVACGEDKDPIVNDRLHWLRDQFETALKSNFTAALNMELVPGLTIAAPADLRGANVRNQLGTEQLDEVLLVTLRRDVDGAMVGAGEWFDVRDPSAAPISLCSIPIGQGWALGQNDQWQNLKFNVPTLSLQLVAILGKRYADAWEKRPFTTFSIVGALTQPDIESLRKFLAGPRGAAETVVVTKRKDPKTQEDLLQFRVPAAVDTMSTFGRLKRLRPALELLESDRTHATFTLTQSPMWYELTNSKDGDPEVRKQVNHLPIAQDRVAIILDSPGLNGGRNPQLNTVPGDARAVGGANVSDVMNAMGDELTASCSGVQIVDPGAAAANLRALLTNKELAAAQQFTFAWKVSLHESVDKKGQFELGVALINLQTQSNIGSASWPRPASQENDGVKIDVTDAHQIARYLTGQTLQRMLSVDARKSVMLVYLKSGTYEDTRDVINAVQKSNLNVEVKQFGYGSGMGYFHLYYAATNPTEVAKVVEAASGEKYQVSTLGPGVLELVKKDATPPPNRRPSKATYAVLVSVTKDGCREDESLLDSSKDLSAVRTILSGPCQFNEDQIVTLCSGTSGAGEPGREPIVGSFDKPPHSNEVSLFYFSGHVKSTQVRNARQWNLVPSDYQGPGDNDSLVPIADLFQKIAETGSTEKFVLIDCYLTKDETGPDDAEGVIKAIKQFNTRMNVLVLCHRSGDPGDQRLPDLLQAAMAKTPKPMTVEQLVEDVKQTHGSGAAQPDNLGATVSAAPSNVLFVVSAESKQQ